MARPFSTTVTVLIMRLAVAMRTTRDDTKAQKWWTHSEWHLLRSLEGRPSSDD
jgi:hypothetical protein